MAAPADGSEDIAEDVVPRIEPHPTVARTFEKRPWHRPRKQFIRKNQWNHEIVEQVVKKRPAAAADQTLRVFGLPSSEYLDLLSMRGFCERRNLQVVYLGFNASYAPADGGRTAGPVDLYQEMQAQRLIAASSFVHPSSTLVPDLFEQVRLPKSMARSALNRFTNFDVVNLDLCGCIVRPEAERATEGLEALAELLRWQSTRRFSPWVLFVTTFASPEEINRPACTPLIEAVKANADEDGDFRTQLEQKVKMPVAELVSSFTGAGGTTPPVTEYIRHFTLAFGKWLCARLRLPTPPSFPSMLPSYCFRHENIDEPHLISLAYLIEPAPSPGVAGVAPTPAPPADHTPLYRRHAKKILSKAFDLKDLDLLLEGDAVKRAEMVGETKQLLVGCGFAESDVDGYLAEWS